MFGGTTAQAGGPAVGGMTAHGGGGATQLGGATSSGGIMAYGGTTASGGATSLGGATSSGGAMSSGGVNAPGGASGSAGGMGGGPSSPCGFLISNPASTGLPNAASYDLSVTGVVIDKITGLMWQRSVPGPDETGCPPDTVNPAFNRCTPSQAAAYCDGLTLAGYTDWYLPSELELASIVDFTVGKAALDRTAFPPTLETLWTSSRYVGSNMPGGDTAGPWLINFGYGTSYHDVYIQFAGVRCVRISGTPAPRCPPSAGRFQIMSSGGTSLVADTITGLVWQQATAPDLMQWSAATAYCGGLAGNFRLPSVKELQSIVNYDSATLGPDFYPEAFPVQRSMFYWTSSPSPYAANAWWVVSSTDGITTTVGLLHQAMFSYLAVLCVH